MSWFEATTPGVTLHGSATESQAFGFQTARITVGQRTDPFEAERLGEVLAEALVDFELLINRWDAQCHWVPSIIGKAASSYGFTVVTSTSLIYWSLELTPDSTMARLSEPSERSSFSVTRDLVEIRPIAEEVFTDYPSHYQQNRWLPEQTTRQAYLQWLDQLSIDPSTIMVVATVDGKEIYGFGILKHTDDETAEFLLAGIKSSYQGMGLYEELTLEMCRQALLAGSRKLVSSTQATNIRGQRAWQRCGLRPEFAIDGCHLISERIAV